jgi:di/tricarboxylate transporter
MLGASAGWLLPYSYQCNLMVMAAGKYKTSDFIKLGAPLHVGVWSTCSEQHANCL